MRDVGRNENSFHHGEEEAEAVIQESALARDFWIVMAEILRDGKNGVLVDHTES